MIAVNPVEKQDMSKASRPHDDAVVELLHEDPAFAMDEINQPGGREALLAAVLPYRRSARYDCRSRTCGNLKGKPLPDIIHEGQPDH